MKKKFSSLLIMMLVVSMVLVGCGKDNPAVDDKVEEDKVVEGEKIVVTDIAGREVEIEGPVERVIVNNRSAFDSLFAILGEDAADMIVGMPGAGRGSEKFDKTYGSKYPELLELDEISANREFDVEKIIALEPDLMIMLNQKVDSDYESLQKVMDAGIPIVGLSYNVEPLRDRVRNLEILGQVFQREERAQEMIQFITDQYDLVEDRLKDLAEEDKIEVHQTHFHGDTPKTFWSWTIISETAGGKEIANDVMGEKLENGGTLDTEFLLKKDPKIITMGIDHLGLMGDEEEGQAYLQEMIQKMPGWNELTAVKEKNFYAISYSSALSLETFYANLQLAKWYYPDLFEDVDPDQVLEEFYTRFMPFPYEGTWSTRLR